jgi:hypothetical protein
MKIYVNGEHKSGRIGIGVYFPESGKGFSYQLPGWNKQVAELCALTLGVSLADPGDAVYSGSEYSVFVAIGRYKPHKHFPLVRRLRFELREGVKAEWIEARDPARKQAARLAKAAARGRPAGVKARCPSCHWDHDPGLTCKEAWRTEAPQLDRECDGARDRDRT